MHSRLIFGIFALALAAAPAAAQGAEALYGKSYALVVGINDYPAFPGGRLKHARKDAEGMADYLRRQGFEVITLYDGQATKARIVYALSDELAPKLMAQDRVIVFFSGHGYTEQLGGREFGYIVPHDGDRRSGSLISMEELRYQSRRMGAAKHQLFIMDACYGGRLVTRSPVSNVSRVRPDYIKALGERAARLVISAGGKDQQVLDGGPKGYSYFTGYLLEALDEGLADGDGDGYITTSELGAYLIPRATNDFQTPGIGTLAEHAQGEMIFRSPRGATVAARPAPATPAGPVLKGGAPSADMDLAFWDEIRDSTNPAEFEAYLKKYPDGAFAELARVRVAAHGAPAEPKPKPQSTLRLIGLTAEKIQSNWPKRCDEIYLRINRTRIWEQPREICRGDRIELDILLEKESTIELWEHDDTGDDKLGTVATKSVTRRQPAVMEDRTAKGEWRYVLEFAQ